MRNQRFPFEIIKLKKWNWKKAEPSIAEKAQPIITLFGIRLFFSEENKSAESAPLNLKNENLKMALEKM